MRIKTIITIMLITLGIIVLTYSGITFKTRSKPIDVLGVHITTTKKHFIPPIAGAVMLISGVGLLVVTYKKK